MWVCLLQVTSSGVLGLCSMTCQMLWPGLSAQALLTLSVCASWARHTEVMPHLQVRNACTRDWGTAVRGAYTPLTDGSCLLRPVIELLKREYDELLSHMEPWSC